MVRPKKTGLDYFSIDVDIVQDLKVRKLLRHKEGARALGVLMGILCQIYKNGYYIDYNEDTLFILASDMYEEESLVNEIVDHCLKVGLFDKEIFDNYHVLTSHGIQERYIAVQAHYKRISIIDKYNLLEKGVCLEDVSSRITIVSSEETHKNTEETIRKDKEYGRNYCKKRVSTEVSTQKKKENKNKNKNKIKILSSTAPAREKMALGENEVFFEGLDAEMDSLQKDSAWLEMVSQLFKLSDPEVLDYLALFKANCLIRGKNRHQNTEDIKSHFSDWLRIQLANSNKQSLDKDNARKEQITQSSSLRRSAAVPIGARQEDFGGEF